MSRRSSMTLVNPDSASIRSPSPPHPDRLKHLPFGLSSEGKAVVLQDTSATDKTYPENAFVIPHLINESDNKGTDPGPYPVETFVKVCPHENLSFGRLQRILSLPKFKSNWMGIDAIGGTKEERHTQLSSSNDRTCQLNDGIFSNLSGTFKLRYNSKHRHGWKGPVIGLELHATWTLARYKVGVTEEDNQASFKDLEKIALCPHNMMNDPWILDALYMIAHPPEVSSDPIDLWNSGERDLSSGRHYTERDIDCDHCKTHIKVSGEDGDRPQVEVLRHLGEGVSENDATWLAQCGVLGKGVSEKDL
ncbi:MAG: hypothetical protein ASARMPREDX12_005942 [Alectoria sarmentosa]|nr:MAG: hypothetical protein ASARMPREDX12_005942 [Alectoria sarmentosa]